MLTCVVGCELGNKAPLRFGCELTKHRCDSATHVCVATSRPHRAMHERCGRCNQDPLGLGGHALPQAKAALQHEGVVAHPRPLTQHPPPASQRCPCTDDGPRLHLAPAFAHPLLPPRELCLAQQPWPRARPGYLCCNLRFLRCLICCHGCGPPAQRARRCSAVPRSEQARPTRAQRFGEKSNFAVALMNHEPPLTEPS